MNTISRAGGLLCILASLAGCANFQSVGAPPDVSSAAIQPGLWRVSAATPGGVPEQTNVCLADPASLKAALLKAADTSEACTSDQQTISNGRIALKSRCAKDQARMELAVIGTYGPTAFTAATEMTVTLDGERAEPVHIATQGKRISATCEDFNLAVASQTEDAQ